MALPKIEHPLFDLTIPSTKQKIKFRPFLVKEEKILLLAQESNNVKDMVSACKQIVTNCVIDNINVDTLPSFDLEYLLVQIRCNSIGNSVNLRFTDPKTNNIIESEVMLDQIQVEFNDNHKSIIDVGNNTKIEMKYPTYSDIVETQDPNKGETENSYKLMLQCVDKIYHGENNVEEAKDYSEEELNEFIESLSPASLVKLQSFFGTMPMLRHTIEYGKEKKKHTFVGMADFFSFA